jgi:protein arginine N-methyltransferase 1
MEGQRRYKKLKIMEALDSEFNNIQESMKELYSQKLIMVNSESESDNIIPEDLVTTQSHHLTQKLTLNKENCDKMFVGINNFKNLEGWLEDKDRIEPYREAIHYNKYKFENKVVYDINSPYGIFGLFALQSNARFVVVTCKKNFSSFVVSIYKDNGFTEDQFLVIEGPLNNIDSSSLSPTQVKLVAQMKENREIDIIVGEWHGTVLVNSKILRDLIEVREHFLKPQGFVFPNKGKLVMNFIEDAKFYGERFDFWDDVYGFNMSNVKETVFQESCLDYCTPDMMQTYDNIFYTLDLNTASTKDLNFVAEFKCKAKKDTMLHAAVINFRVEFENCHFQKHYSNSPFGKKINFSQCILYLKNPFKVRASTFVSGKVAMLEDLTNAEKLKVKILVKYPKKKDQIQYFHVD